MKRHNNSKRTYAYALSLVLALAALSPISVNAAYEIESLNYYEDAYNVITYGESDSDELLPVYREKNENYTYNNVAESVAPIQAILTSAIDGSPFIAYFNPETGRVSSYDLAGSSLGFRYVESESAFWDLVEINSQAINNVALQSFIREARQVEVFVELENAALIDFPVTTTVFDPESGRVSLYDDSDILVEYRYGYDEDTFAELINAQNELARLQLAEPSLAYVGVEETYQAISPSNFDTGTIRVTVPFGSDPLQHGVPITPNWLPTNSGTRSITLQTFAFPTGMFGMDYVIINNFGDFLRMDVDMPANTRRTYNIQFPGDSFAAFVNSYDGTFHNVQLRFHADNAPSTQPPIPQTVQITFNVNGGSTSNSTFTRTVGQPLGHLPTPFWTNHTFRGWYTTPSGAGQRITSETITPSTNTTYFARWYSHRTRTLTHTGSAMATGIGGQQVTSTPISFNGNTIPQGAVIEGISVNAGNSTMSGAILPTVMHITNGIHGTLNAPWNGANNSVVSTSAFNGLNPRTTWTIHWSGSVISNLGTSVRGYSNMRLTINYRVTL